MHLAAWLSVLSCLVRLISLVYLVYLYCLIFPSRYFVSKDLVDDLTYICTSAISVICAGEEKNVKNVICSSSSSSSYPSSYPFSCSAPLSVSLKLSWVSAKSDKQVQNCIPFICLPIQSVSQPSSQPVTYSMCRSSVPFHSTVYSPVPIRFVSTCEREFSTLSFSVQAAA